jgi:hypothetical protein
LITRRLITQSIDLGFREGKGREGKLEPKNTENPKNKVTQESLSKAHFTLGVKANVQLKSSIPIGAKVEISLLHGVYTRSQGWSRKKNFNVPQVTNKC